MGAAASTDTSSGDAAAVAAAMRAERAQGEHAGGEGRRSRPESRQPLRQSESHAGGGRMAARSQAQQLRHTPSQQLRHSASAAAPGADYFERDEEERRLNPRQAPNLTDALAQYVAPSESSQRALVDSLRVTKNRQ
jgi:hypothetical protein